MPRVSKSKKPKPSSDRANQTKTGRRESLPESLGALPKGQRYDLDRVVRLVISVVTLVAVIWLLRYLSNVLIPFAIALLVAYLLHPTVTHVERRIGNRSAAVLITVFGLLLLGGATLAMLVPVISVELADFREAVADMKPTQSTDAALEPDADLTLVERFDVFINAQTSDQVRWLLTKIRDLVARERVLIEQYVVDLGKKVAPGLWGVVTGALQFLIGLTGLLVVLLYVIFLLNDFRRVQGAWHEILPPNYREPLAKFVGEFEHAMSRYFRGQFVIALCTAFIMAVGFYLIGLRLGILLGIVIGMMNMVPYLQTIGIVPALIMALLRSVETGSSALWTMTLTLLVFAVAQILQDAVLTPRIMGQATGLRPAIILLGIFVWGKLLGFLGVVLAIPLTCLGLAYYRRWVLHQHDAPVMVEEGDGAEENGGVEASGA
jgi:predicted PurR-regulated permease PerM